MSIANPNFAEAGEAPGVPRGWAVQSFVRARRSAGFGPEPFEGVESFERWAQLVLNLGLVEQAFFDARPEGYEDFSDGWDVDTYVLDFSNVPAQPAFEPEGVDRFVRGWSTEGFAWSFDDSASVQARFLGDAFEQFERGHRNDPYHWAFSGATSDLASFGGASAEMFETTWPAHDERGGGHHGE